MSVLLTATVVVVVVIVVVAVSYELWDIDMPYVCYSDIHTANADYSSYQDYRV